MSGMFSPEVEDQSPGRFPTSEEFGQTSSMFGIYRLPIVKETGAFVSFDDCCVDIQDSNFFLCSWSKNSKCSALFMAACVGTRIKSNLNTAFDHISEVCFSLYWATCGARTQSSNGLSVLSGAETMFSIWAHPRKNPGCAPALLGAERMTQIYL